MYGFKPNFDALVDKFMDSYGFSCTIIRQGNNYDPTTSENITTEQLIPCTGILFDYTLRQLGDKNVADSLIQSGDKQLFIKPVQKAEFGDLTTITNLFTSSDSIEIGSIRYKVITFKQINPTTANPYVWELSIRK